MVKNVLEKVICSMVEQKDQIKIERSYSSSHLPRSFKLCHA